MNFKRTAIPGSPMGLMWITADRVFYVGLLGAPTVRTMGSVIVYVAVSGTIRIRLRDGEWQTTEMAVVPPYVPHQVESQARIINVLKIEAETVDLDALPDVLKGSGAVDEPEFVQLVRRRQGEMSAQGCAVDLLKLDFDKTFFGAALMPRHIDRRIAAVLDRIRQDPSAPAIAEECAATAHLSFSRFLHLFKQELGASFRSFRTWKRARCLLHYVNRKANLTHVALDTGYPDSTHFSHSIRQVYGLKPRDIFAGSRRLALFDDSPPLQRAA
jgi:AraC-like DNA-binding protein